MNEEIFDIVKQISARHPDIDQTAKDTIKGWEKEAVLLMNRQKLLDNPAIKDKVKELNQDIENCNSQLLTQREMTEVERARIFDKKDLFERELEFYNCDFDKKLSNIKGQLTKELKHFEEFNK